MGAGGTGVGGGMGAGGVEMISIQLKVVWQALQGSAVGMCIGDLPVAITPS